MLGLRILCRCCGCPRVMHRHWQPGSECAVHPGCPRWARSLRLVRRPSLAELADPAPRADLDRR
jgi:hypothetical protein